MPLFNPISDRLKGCRTQFEGETVSPSMRVTSSPPG